MARPHWPRTRRVAGVLLLSMGLLGACTSGSVEATNTSPPPTRRRESPGAGLPEGRGLVAEERDGTRTVTSSWGTVTVPREPERVVSVTGHLDLASMLALGITPVGAGTPTGVAGEPFAPPVADLAEGVKPLAWADGVPVEAIARLEPDLIFAADEQTAELLSDIAPTVPRGSAIGADWKQDFRYVASVLGEQEEAAERLADWERRAGRLYATVADTMDGRTVASTRLTADHSTVRIDPPGAFSSVVLDEIGLEIAPVARAAEETQAGLPMHELQDLNADVLFWQVSGDEQVEPGATGLTLVKATPAWGTLPAVQGGAVHEVDVRSWGSPTILGAEQILTDVEQALA